MSRSPGERWGAGVRECGREWLWAMSRHPLSPRSLLSGAFAAVQSSAAALGALLPGAGPPAAWLESANKLRAYRLFAFADTLVPESAAGWSAVGGRLRELDPCSRVWVAEGLGYWFARRGGLSELRFASVDAPVLVPMHTGAGLALAGSALRSAQRGGLGEILRRYRGHTRSVARDGFDEVVYEALGLVAVTLFPGLVAEIARQLPEDGPLFELFWHGVGRGLYFLPLHFLPAGSARRRPVEFASSEPATSLGRRNAIAGLAWAMSLVNVHDPEVVMEWLRHNADVSDRDALRDGIASALVVWRACAPDDRAVEAWAVFDPPDAGLWASTAGAALDSACRATCPPAAVFRLHGARSA